MSSKSEARAHARREAHRAKQNQRRHNRNHPVEASAKKVGNFAKRHPLFTSSVAVAAILGCATPEGREVLAAVYDTVSESGEQGDSATEAPAPEGGAPTVEESPEQQPSAGQGSIPTEGSFQEQVRAALDQAGISEHSTDVNDWFRPFGDEGAVRDHFDQGASRYENPKRGLITSACGAVANPHNEGLIEAGISDNQEEWHGKIVVRIVEDNFKAGPACVNLVLNGLDNSPDNIQLHYGS